MCPVFKWDFHFEANLPGVQNPNVWNNGQEEKKKDHQMLVGENYA